jgi:HD-GYP domain-containing protein (c-di-GMP phosphodiesterase class II)
LQEFREILPIVRHHHERYDGRGYPMHLYREKIPFGARILSVADAFDAMLSARPYRSGLTFDEALLRLRQAAGSQLDPGLVDLFIPFAKSEKFRETLRAAFWTLPAGNENNKSIASDNYPPDILKSFVQIPSLKSPSPDYRV